MPIPPDQRSSKEQIAMAALRASVHFSGELLSIVESSLPAHAFAGTKLAAALAQDIAAMQAFVDLLRQVRYRRSEARAAGQSLITG